MSSTLVSSAIPTGSISASISVVSTTRQNMVAPPLSDSSNYPVPTRPFTVLFSGDPHFKASNVREMDEMTKKFIQLVKDKKPHLVTLLGDQLDTHEKTHLIPLQNCTQFMWDLAQLTPLVVLVGNHDRISNSDFLSETHAFTAMKHWPNTTIVDTTKIITMEGYTFFAVPYVPPGRFEEALLKVNTNVDGPPNYRFATSIFAHQEFFGAKMGVIASRVGDVWPANYPQVISGHIHEYDELQSNLLYCGTPLQHSFGDQDCKTVSLVTFYPNHSFEHQRIDLQLIRKKTVYLKPDEALTYVVPPSSQIKLIIRGSSAEIKAIMKAPHLQELASQGVKIAYKYTEDPETKQMAPGEASIKTCRYLEQLHAEIASDPEQTKWYEKLFGRPKPQITLRIVKSD